MTFNGKVALVTGSTSGIGLLTPLEQKQIDDLARARS